jgi:hypothetical protein
LWTGDWQCCCFKCYAHKICCALDAGGYAFGDVLTQQLGPLWLSNDEDWPSKHNPAKHDLNKTAGMAAVGVFLGLPTSLAMYAVMDSMAPGTGMVLMAAKFAADQVVGCVLWQAAYMCISEPYRRTFSQFASAQWQQHQQQRDARVTAAAGVGPAVAAC